jgi:SAM-dependent methyltransferase
MPDPRDLLAFSPVYRFVQWVFGGGARHAYVRDYLRVLPGERVLDVGCGPADVLAHLDPSVRYTGVDLSPRYIDAARRRFGGRGEFYLESVRDTTVREPGSFDLVMANGLIHHLDDEEARRLLETAREALKPTGRFVSLDGCFVAGQGRLARWLVSRDRGRFVRHRDDYLRLAREVFPSVTWDVRHDLTRVPYTHLIMTCRPAARAAARRAAAAEERQP